MSARQASTSTYVALLRGVNVGGKNLLPMAHLSTIFSRCNCANVRTYIQSGNVLFSTASENVDRVMSDVSGAIESAFGFRVPLVVRSGQQMQRAAMRNPFLKQSDPAQLYVGFLQTAVPMKRIAALDENRSPGDNFAVLGGEIYLRLSNHAAKTRLTNAYFDKALDTISTFRNWRTVLKLRDMAKGIT